ncbi:MAG: hypothetical protein HYS23_07580 [Geobacter sp.]|nr:hypothetical protein [Geobacter sp.]
MSDRLFKILSAFSFFLLLALCYWTGDIESPFRYLYYPLIILYALRLSFNTLLLSGLCFCSLFIGIFLLNRPGYQSLLPFFTEVSSFFFAAAAAGVAARSISKEKVNHLRAVETFQALSNTLSHRTMNLQTTLDALTETHKRLQEADRRKTDFLGNVSHELRTPLSSIRSYSEILLNYEDIDRETEKEFVKIINVESEIMTAMVNDLLDLVRVDAGKVEFAMSRIKVCDLIEESVKVVMPMATEKGLNLVKDLPPETVNVKGDKNQLNQVLVNLLNNAVKFTAKGTITAGVRKKDGYAEFFVADTGEGIFPDEKEKIFEEFYRISESVPSRPKGTGLGLSISRKIVEFHEGKIWVESEVGKGSTFYFTTPLFVEIPQFISEESARETARHAGSRRPILVHSGDIAIRHSLRKKLEDMGYSTLGADTPGRAMDVAQGMPTGLIISDVTERWDEFNELERWARNSDIPLLLAFLYIPEEGGEPRIAMSGYIFKPLDRYAILSVLQLAIKPRGRIVVVSPDKDESRTLEVMLGTEGFDVSLYSDAERALQSCVAATPAGVIIGSFAKETAEEVVKKLRINQDTAQTPVFMILNISSGRHAKTLTLSTAGRRVPDSISPLVNEIDTIFMKSSEGIEI